jgi:hypothetical protein
MMKKLRAGLLVLVFALLPFDVVIAQVPGVYHEASCPSVDQTRMKRLKRNRAIELGLASRAGAGA